MEENGIMESGIRTSTRSSQEIAETIVRDAETRGNPKAASAESDNPAPLSSALGIPTLLKESQAAPDERRREDLRREEGEPLPDPDEAKRKQSRSKTDEEFFVSSGLGLPLLADNPTPLSSALHIPTLLDESKPH